jgi:hypothetical protein
LKYKKKLWFKLLANIEATKTTEKYNYAVGREDDLDR